MSILLISVDCIFMERHVRTKILLECLDTQIQNQPRNWKVTLCSTEIKYITLLVVLCGRGYRKHCHNAYGESNLLYEDYRA